MAIGTSAISLRRLARQRLTQDAMASAEEVVGWLGAVQAQDFAGAWWSGLTGAEVKRGIELVGMGLDRENIDGASYWFTPSKPPVDEADASTFLLPAYDEFFMGFTGESRAAGLDVRELVFDSMIVIGGQIAGTWRRTFEQGVPSSR